MKTRILLADDDTLFAQALAQLLAERYEVVDIVGDGKALEVAARKHRPDVIITDVTMPLRSGLDSVRSLHEQSYAPKVIFLTMHSDIELARECLKCGGSAFVSKTFSYDELILALDAVLAGHIYLSPNIAAGVLNTSADPASASPHAEELTRRQREILQMLAEGKTMKEIASLTDLSTRTVEWHKYRMMRILHVQRSAELVRAAVRLKLVL